MNIIVNIGGIDRTATIGWTNFTVEDNINDMANSCSFNIKKIDSGDYTPTIGEEVIVNDGANKIFGGYIVLINNTVSKGIITYSVICKDYTHDLQRQLVTDRFTDTDVETVIKYIIDNYTNGITYTNVVCTVEIETIAFNGISVIECLNILVGQTNYNYYIDYDKDLHFFEKNTELAPFNLTASSDNFIYDSLIINNDITQLRNVVIIRGGEKVATNTRTTSDYSDGENKTFNTNYKFSSKPIVKVDGSTVTVGTEYLNSSGYDCYWDYNQKYVRFENIITSGLLVEITAKPLIPIIVRVEDAGSISSYGIKEFKKVDKTIKSADEAKQYGNAQLEAYGKKINEGNFETYESGLVSGQLININIPSRGISGDFVIQTAQLEMQTANTGKWLLTLASLRTLSIIQFLQGLFLSSNQVIEIDENEVLEKAYYANEDFNITEEVEQKSKVANQENIEITEYVAREPSDIDFVLAPYTPTGTTDPKREFMLDRGLLG